MERVTPEQRVGEIALHDGEFAGSGLAPFNLHDGAISIRGDKETPQAIQCLTECTYMTMDVEED